MRTSNFRIQPYMNNKITKTVGLDVLQPHPMGIETYQVSNVDALAESIEEIGLNHYPIVNQEMQVLSGMRRIKAFELLGRNEITVEVIEITKEDEPAFVILSNSQRQKTEIELYKEIKFLKNLFGNRRGQRSDLMKDLEPSEEGSNRERIAKAVKKPESTVHRIEFVGDKDEKMLELVANGHISLHEAYQACKSEKPKHEKESEEIDLCEIKNCPFCGNVPARIIIDDNGNLIYKPQN